MSLVGTTTGSIYLEALLGKGGMGEVYLGFDRKLERRVAVKTIRAEHRLQGDVRARFLREARILSKLEHPAICQVYDLIERPEADFLVFEFVDGTTLGELDRREKLGERPCLELFEKIALGLAVAHRERIIHRDLKPDNVMVTPARQVKILDFGIARALGQTALAAEPRVAETPSDAASWPPFDPAGTVPAEQPTLLLSTASTRPAATQAPLTQQGWVLGTVRYMSPEQARGQELTEASDLFSFGIMLQELLTGRPAYPPDTAPLQLLLKVANDESFPVEGVDPDAAQLIRDLKHPNPLRRPSAEQTAERIRQVLEKPQRLRRLRLRLAAAAAAFVVLTVVLVVVSVLAFRLKLEAERSEREAATAHEVTEFLIGLFDQAKPESAHGRTVTALELVDEGARKVDRELARQPLIQARLQDALGEIYLRLAQHDHAASLIQAALATRERLLGAEDPAVAESLNQLAAIYTDEGRYAEAEATFERAARILERSRGPDDLELAVSLNDLGNLYTGDGRFEQAETLYRRALAIREKTAKSKDAIAATLNNLAILYWQQERYAEAEPLYLQALAILEAEAGPDHPDVARQLNNLGILYRKQGKLAAAEPLHQRALAVAEKALGPKHPDIAAILKSFARLRLEQGRREEALALFERALAIDVEALGEDHPEVAALREERARLHAPPDTIENRP